MSLLTHLNLNYLRIFLVVYRTRSMTLAAKELHLTQSGVSQQIKSLEETLNITLFDRINRRIIPTNEAEILYRECSRRLQDLERALTVISKKDEQLRGDIKIGYPPIFGHHSLLPLISQFAQDHQLVHFHLHRGLASELTPMLLRGELDFAFIDSHSSDPSLLYHQVAEQELVLVIPKCFYQKSKLEAQHFESIKQLPFVAYTASQAFLKQWFKQNFAKQPLELQVRAYVSDSNAAARFVLDSLAAGLFPRMMADSLTQQSKDLIIPSDQSAVINPISVCRIAKRTLGNAAETCLNWLNNEYS